MKKFLSILLALTLCLGTVAFAEPNIAATNANTLVVGTPEMNGEFIDGFSGSSYDDSIRTMVHGYCSTVEITAGGEYVMNPNVVKNIEITEDEAGNKTYTFEIFDDLKWSNGNPITAKDYIGALLWKISPKWIEVGATSSVGTGLLGYKDFLDGKIDIFPGAKLIDDYKFALTIDAVELPYFYETTYVLLEPICIDVYAPGAEIISDEQGTRFNPEYDLKAAMQHVSETERFAPTVACGPYQFLSFENQTVTLEINPYFKGDLDGQKPQIQYVVQKAVNRETDVDAVISGDLDLVWGVIEGKKIEAAKASGTAQLHSYLRAGYGKMSMACDFGATADVNVRWALAYLLDRATVNDYVLGGYGGIVHAQYGYAQWMYDYAGEELDELLVPFNLNIDKANEYLDKTEWLYEADGTTPWDASKASGDGEYFRHNAAGERLTINHMGTDANSVTDIIEIQFSANAPMAGIDFVVTKGDFNALLQNFSYGYEMGEDRYLNSVNMASSFEPRFDPYFSWHSDYCGTYYNSCQLSDAELDQIIMDMRAVEPGNNDEYVDLWLKYQKRWQELMPEIPLYSNEYFDICSQYVDGIATSPFHGYEDCICKMTKTVD